MLRLLRYFDDVTLRLLRYFDDVMQCLSRYFDDVSCRLKSKLGPLQFSVEVLKHEESDSNAVLVYLDSRQLTDTRPLVCVAHSIDPAQIAPADKVVACRPLVLITLLQVLPLTKIFITKKCNSNLYVGTQRVQMRYIFSGLVCTNTCLSH